MSAKVTLQFAVDIGHEVGDYAQLFGNGGDGVVDYDTPLLNGRKFDLFPQGAGIYGCGHEPCGHSPCGFGTAVIEAEVIIETCGEYKFAFACFDSLGNPDEGAPQELLVSLHTAPPAPTGLIKNSYDKDTDVLILDAA